MSWHSEAVGNAECEVRVPEITGKQRPRAQVVGGHARVYTPTKTAKFEKVIASAWLEQVGTRWVAFEGEVWITVTFRRELAKSNPKYWDGRADLSKPDADNMLKAVLDALNGVAFADDSQITRIEAIKGRRKPHGEGCFVSIEASYHEETYEKGE
ncbi:RusA family crossover junction endodeoxyribonuclease [Olsenella sp. HMSC062G07]|uniref:RusA family crossover junction endodeoxyribonuclease n=1 Tax=Olsenella sp. HMSC062G07 TaxID=1739330 RepID=UPI0008A30942|nr:RusA family crossover junction endodeoxyribonuclease [Olsenella sp. HMSC062G07]OFK25066.1 hypothetical protein HMPREF2826_00320 [Olsenella sp. HMSC062G07]